MTHHPSDGDWRKSSYSGSGNNCVEVAPHDAAVTIRDSTDMHGPALTTSIRAWAEFTQRIKTETLYPG